jgi:hypothetical protein
MTSSMMLSRTFIVRGLTGLQAFTSFLGRRPSPWLASPSKSRSTKASAARRTEGEEAARVFRLIDHGVSLREIVMRTRVPPHRVRALYREWQRSLEDGPPRDEYALGDGAELDAIAVAAEDLFARQG